MANQGSRSQWSIQLSGTHGVVEIVLNDREGRRASRTVHDGRGVVEIVTGWQQQYDCEANILFGDAIPEASEEVQQTLSDWLVPLIKKQHRFASPAAMKRVLDLTGNSYRPEPIRRISEEIDAETRVAEVRALATGQIDEQQIHEIVDKKLRRDGLYCDWANGVIE